LCSRVVSVTKVHATAVPLLGTHNEDEVVLAELTSSDLLLQGVAANVNINVQLVTLEELLELIHVVVKCGDDRDDEDLTGAEPEWPLAAKVLGQDTQESLEATNDSAVNDNRAGTASRKLIRVSLALGLLLFSGMGLLVGHILELEVDWCLVVQLDGCTLELSLKGIGNSDIDLGTVEGTITLVDGPVITHKLGQSLLQLLLGEIPGADLTHVLLGPGRQLQLEAKTEQTIDRLQEIEETLNFRHDLVGSTEDVSVVLLEFANTSQSAQGTRGLVTVQNTKVGNTHGQLAVTTLTMTEQDEVTGAVHGLETPLPLFNVQLEHVVRIVVPVTRLLPQADIIHVRGLDLLVPALAVLRAQKCLESIENSDTGGEEEGTSRCDLVKEEKLLLLTQFQMVALLCFGTNHDCQCLISIPITVGDEQEVEVLLHQRLVGEGNAANSL